jgi:hypothetical protein
MAEIPNFPNWTRTSMAPSGPGAPTYINGVQVLFSPWDFNVLLFHGFPGNVTLPAEPGGSVEIGIEQRLLHRVVMSPQHAKALLRALGENVEKYEKEHGEIPVIDLPATSTTTAEASPETEGES